MSSVGTVHMCRASGSFVCESPFIVWTEVHPYKMHRASGSEVFSMAIAKSSVGTIDIITPDFSPVPRLELGETSSVGTVHICRASGSLVCGIPFGWTEVHPYKMHRASGSKEVPTAIAKSSEELFWRVGISVE